MTRYEADTDTVHNWIDRHADRAGLIASGKTSPHHQDRFADTVDGYYVDTDELESWFSYTTGDVYDTTRCVTAYHTNRDDRYVLYERQIVERDRTLVDALAHLLLPGRAICYSDKHDAKGISLILVYIGLVALIAGLPAMVLSGVALPAALLMFTAPGLFLLFGEYHAAPARGIHNKSACILDESTLRKRLQNRSEVTRDELPEVLRAPSLAEGPTPDIASPDETTEASLPSQGGVTIKRTCPKCGHVVPLQGQKPGRNLRGICRDCRTPVFVSR